MERAGSRSTAFFRMVAARGDVRALHEPFAKVIDHGETELHGHTVTSTDELIDRLLHLAERIMVVLFKDTTDKRHQHVLERPDFLRSGRHTLLIRDPRSATGDRRPGTLMALTPLSAGVRSGSAEHVVCADAPPDDVRLAGEQLGAVLPGSSAVGCPGHLEHAGPALHALHPQAGTELATGFQVGDHLRDRGQELPSLRGIESSPVASERRLPFVGGAHTRVGPSTASVSAARNSPSLWNTRPWRPDSSSASTCCSPACQVVVQNHA